MRMKESEVVRQPDEGREGAEGGGEEGRRGVEGWRRRGGVEDDDDVGGKFFLFPLPKKKKGKGASLPQRRLLF